jgi:hypothetical protein
MMISWSKCRPLKRSCAEVGSVIPAVIAGYRALQQFAPDPSNHRRDEYQSLTSNPRGDAADHHEQSDGLVRQQFLSEHQQAECRAAGSTYAAIWLVSDAD